MSEQIEKTDHIITPDLLNYLEMVESRETIGQRFKKNIFPAQKEKRKNELYKRK